MWRNNHNKILTLVSIVRIVSIVRGCKDKTDILITSDRILLCHNYGKLNQSYSVLAVKVNKHIP